MHNLTYECDFFSYCNYHKILFEVILLRILELPGYLLQWKAVALSKMNATKFPQYFSAFYKL